MCRPDLCKPIMDKELRVMKDRGVFHVVDATKVLEGKKITICQWVYAVKYNMEGNMMRCKARLVEKGYLQVIGEDYEETYVAVIRLESIYMSAAVMVQMDWHIWQVDSVSTYLNSIPNFQVYMKVPYSFPEGRVRL